MQRRGSFYYSGLKSEVRWVPHGSAGFREVQCLGVLRGSVPQGSRRFTSSGFTKVQFLRVLRGQFLRVQEGSVPRGSRTSSSSGFGKVQFLKGSRRFSTE